MSARASSPMQALPLNDLHVSKPFEFGYQFLFTDHQFRTNFVEAMGAVEVLGQGGPFLPLSPLPTQIRAAGGRRHGVLVHAVEKAFDDAKRDEAPDIHDPHHLGVLHAPVPQALPLPQRAKQFHQPRPHRPRVPVPLRSRQSAVRPDHVPPAFLLRLFVRHEPGHFGRGRVAGAEVENVEQDDAAVVEEMLDGVADEPVVGVGPEGNLPDAVETVNVRQDEEHGQIPIVVRQGLQTDGAQGHLVRADGRRRRIGGEEFDVEGVGVIDGDHAFAVVVQVLEQDLAERVDLARVGRGAVGGQKAGLGLEGAEERGEFIDDGLVRRGVGGDGKDEGEIENVLVAVVVRRGDAYWVTEDAIFRSAEGDGMGAEILARDDVGGVAGEVEEGRMGGGGGGDNGVAGDLMNHLGA